MLVCVIIPAAHEDMVDPQLVSLEKLGSTSDTVVEAPSPGIEDAGYLLPKRLGLWRFLEACYVRLGELDELQPFSDGVRVVPLKKCYQAM